MIRRIASFFLWHHVKATLLTSASVMIASILYRIAVSAWDLYSRLSLNAGTGNLLDNIVMFLGFLAFIVFIFSLMLYRRRKLDGSLEKS